MQFNNPNILYALFALLIPVIVHLFQLRKFQKTAFTNVKFLKELALKTRKSSQLKKWLLLTCRLLVFTCVILAFAEPFFKHKGASLQKPNTVFYIDNSYSNQVKGDKGELLKVAIQELLEYYPQDENISIITNTATFKNKTLHEIKNDLIALDYSPTQLNYKAITLKAEQIFNDAPSKLLVCISDFQQANTIDSSYFKPNYNTKLVQLTPVSKSNISIDSAYFKSDTPTSTELQILIKKQHNTQTSVPLAIYNHSDLISKTAVLLKDDINTHTVSIPNTNSLNLKIEVTEKNNVFDNTLFVSKPEPNKQHVLSIGTQENNQFLSKIFTSDEFIYSENTSKNIAYNTFEKQQVIIINELEIISTALYKNLNSFAANGGVVICIPSEKGIIDTYNSLNNVFSNTVNQKSRLTKIHSAHPIYTNVFDKKVSNFQYPTFKTHYKLKNYNSTLLSLENGNPLLVNNGNFYTFSAALNTENTNFKQAPLIVPTLYNIAKSSLKSSKPYYTIGEKQTIDIPLKLTQDDVLNLQRNSEKFTPLQQIKKENVTLTTHKNPTKSGIFNVTHKAQQTPFNLAFNYNRTESIMSYHDISLLENTHIKTATSIINTINTLNSATQVATLWKWFVIFAVVFLLVELLILNYFK